MKIKKGVFPWRLLYGPLLIAGLIAAVFISIFDSWNEPIGPSIMLFGVSLCWWYMALMIISGVSPGRFGDFHRSKSPAGFWTGVAIFGVFSVVFIAMFFIAVSRGE